MAEPSPPVDYCPAKRSLDGILPLGVEDSRILGSDRCGLVHPAPHHNCVGISNDVPAKYARRRRIAHTPFQ